MTNKPIRGYGFGPIEQRIIRMRQEGLQPRAIAKALHVRRRPVETTLNMWEDALNQGEIEIKMVGDEMQILKRG